MKVQKRRIGEFFLFICLVLMILFFASDQGETPMIGLFFASLLSGLLGFYFIRKDWKPPAESARFRMFRKSSQNKQGEENKDRAE